MNKIENNIKLIQTFQEKYDVSQLKVKGIEIWPLILFELDKDNENQPKKFKKNLFKMAFNEFNSLFKMQYASLLDHKNNFRQYNNADVLILTQSTRRLKIGKNYFDRMTDPFVDAFQEIGFKCQVMEWSYDHQYKVPRHNPSDLIQFQINLAAARAIFQGKWIKTEPALLKTEEFLEIVKSHGFELTQFIDNIDMSIRIIFSIKKLFEKRLENYRAKIALYFPYYSLVSFAFSLACKTKNIASVEIQHGYISEASFMQNTYRNLSMDYDLLPDSIWCWDNKAAEIILNWSKKTTCLPRIYVGGNLWLNNWLYPEVNKTRILDTFKRELENLKKKHSKIIIYTLNPFIDIPDWLPEALKSVDNNVLHCMRFHHNSVKKFRDEIKNKLSHLSNIEFDISNTHPLPALLNICDVHVTIDSSSIAEAIDFQKPSIIIHENGVILFRDIIEEQKWAFSALKKDDFVILAHKLIKEASKGKENLNVKSNAEILQDFYNFICTKTQNSA